MHPQLELTRIIVTQILSFATILFALCPQVGIDRTFLVGLQNDTEDLFSGPKGHGLMDRQHGGVLVLGHNRIM